MNADTGHVYRLHRYWILLSGLIALLVCADQWTKHLAVQRLRGTDGIALIPGVLELQYLENRGAAFGVLQGKQWFFWILTAVFLFVALYVLLRVPRSPRYLPLSIAVAVLAAGAIGNLIDRVAHRYVVDFIYLKLINFPIFNVADICVTLSVISIVLLVLFRYKDGELDMILPAGRRAKKEAGGNGGEECSVQEPEEGEDP